LKSVVNYGMMILELWWSGTLSLNVWRRSDAKHGLV
jgi:hypothetical protein